MCNYVLGFDGLCGGANKERLPVSIQVRFAVFPNASRESAVEIVARELSVSVPVVSPPPRKCP